MYCGTRSRALRCGVQVSVNRPNLFYEVAPKPAGGEELLDEIAAWVGGRYPAGESGILYVLTRKETETFAEARDVICWLLIISASGNSTLELFFSEPCSQAGRQACVWARRPPCPLVLQGLRQRGLRAAHYHADMEPAGRQAVHQQWAQGSVQIVVATIAFGMGINKTSGERPRCRRGSGLGREGGVLQILLSMMGIILKRHPAVPSLRLRRSALCAAQLHLQVCGKLLPGVGEGGARRPPGPLPPLLPLWR